MGIEVSQSQSKVAVKVRDKVFGVKDAKEALNAVQSGLFEYDSLVLDLSDVDSVDPKAVAFLGATSDALKNKVREKIIIYKDRCGLNLAPLKAYNFKMYDPANLDSEGKKELASFTEFLNASVPLKLVEDYYQGLSQICHAFFESILDAPVLMSRVLSMRDEGFERWLEELSSGVGAQIEMEVGDYKGAVNCFFSEETYRAMMSSYFHRDLAEDSMELVDGMLELLNNIAGRFPKKRKEGPSFRFGRLAKVDLSNWHKLMKDYQGAAGLLVIVSTAVGNVYFVTHCKACGNDKVAA